MVEKPELIRTHPLTTPPYKKLDTMGNANGDSTGSSLFDTTIIWWLIWLGAAITFILCPFIGSSNRRKLCAARIRERQWDVDVEMDRESSWYRAAAER
jgi:hypothetical protein